MFTSQRTPSTPSQVNMPRQPTAHIVPSGKQPNVLPSTHAAFVERRFVQAHVDDNDDVSADRGATAPATAAAAASSPVAVLVAVAGAAVQFIIGVVKSRGEASIAHIENSVMDSSSVTFGGPRVGSKPEAGPVPVCSMSRSFHLRPHSTEAAARCNRQPRRDDAGTGAEADSRGQPCTECAGPPPPLSSEGRLTRTAGPSPRAGSSTRSRCPA